MTPDQALDVLIAESQAQGNYGGERERFDKWAANKIWDITYDDEDPSRYEKEYVQSAWGIWQARAAQADAHIAQDAARYQWLRDYLSSTMLLSIGTDEIDAAIDSAIEPSPPGATK